MIPFNIDYEGAIDFEHCDSIHEASQKLSELTNLLNKVISVRCNAKNKILEICSLYPNEKMHKLSWENKVVCLMFASGRSQEVLDVVKLYNDSDEAYIKIRNKQSQVIEDLMALKKIADITPR